VTAARVVLSSSVVMMHAPQALVRSPAASGSKARGAHVYHRAPAPVFFPAAEEAPVTNRHLEIRTALYQTLKRELASVATLGSDQFVYWDPRTAKKRLAPDAFVRLGAPHRTFRSWKIWERGAPDLGVEVVSDSDEGEPAWDEKLERYRAAGIGEVVRFHPEDREQPIRIWDAVDGDLVERAEDDPDLHRCETLDLWWVTVEDAAIGPMLRLARDREGKELLPTPEEAEAKEREANAQLRAAAARLRAETSAAAAQLRAETSAAAAQLRAEARAAEARAKEAEGRAQASEATANEAASALRAEVEALRAELKKAKAAPRKRR
jgi:Uma2 family endonuclease